MSLFEFLFPMSGPLTDEPILECCFAVILPALASAIIFNMDASSGGTDIIAMILNKYAPIRTSEPHFSLPTSLLRYSRSRSASRHGLLSVLGWFSKSLVIDSVIESINKCKVFTIVCRDPDKITEFIMKDLNRSATIEEAVGAYTHDKRFVVTSIVGRSQAVRLRNFIRHIAPDSFITISNSSEIIGNGFRSHI